MGFTSLELILVMALLPIMVGVYIAYTDISAAALDRAVRRLESDLRYAQQLATTEEVPCGFMTTSNQSYQIYRQTPGNLVLDPQTRQGMAMSFAGNYPGVTFTTAYHVEFDTQGRPTQGSNLAITLRRSNRSRSIGIATTTGLIQVQ